MTATTASAPTLRLSPRTTLLGGAVLLLLSMLVAASTGAYAISAPQLLGMWSGLWQPDTTPTPEQLVFMHIRLPRVLLGVAAGAGLGVAGTLMQGIFRNPLADPGLIGISSGAALAAGLTIVMGAAWWPDMPRLLGSWTLVVMAFSGGFLVTLLIYGLSQSEGGTRMALMLLAGIAINALAGAGLGLLSVIATDAQLRSLQFWLLGSLGGARWDAIVGVGLVVGLVCLTSLRLGPALNAMALGEAAAALLGVRIERTKQLAILLTALAVGTVTATTGVIGFIGLIAPHWVRLVAGPDHRVVLPAAALLGAALVLLADAVARTAAAPAELPLGVLTALLGVPVFLFMLRHFRGRL